MKHRTPLVETTLEILELELEHDDKEIHHGFCGGCYEDYSEKIISICGKEITGEPIMPMSEIPEDQICTVCINVWPIHRRLKHHGS